MGKYTYTAQEMREMATEAEVIEVPDQFYGQDMNTIADMLRQAADDMEREGHEKKYEYAIKFADGTVSMLHEDVYAEGSSLPLVRREVGAWEDVLSDT